MKKITQCRGKAANLRHTISSDNEILSHIALFELENQKIMLKMAEPVFLDNDDEIVVIGWIKDNLFHGIAYYNVSKQIAIKASPVWMLLVFIIPFFVVGLLTTIFGIGLIFLGISLSLIYKLKLTLRANEMISNLIKIT
jgi:hypothetical protein